MRTLARRIARWPAAIACVTAIFAGSSIPARRAGAIPRTVPGIGLPTDKIAHVGEFAALGFLLTGALRHDEPHPMRPATAALAALAAGAAFGALDELHQRAVAGRVAAWDDIAADAFGSGAGALAALILLRDPAAAA